MSHLNRSSTRGAGRRVHSDLLKNEKCRRARDKTSGASLRGHAQLTMRYLGRTVLVRKFFLNVSRRNRSGAPGAAYNPEKNWKFSENEVRGARAARLHG